MLAISRFPLDSQTFALFSVILALFFALFFVIFAFSRVKLCVVLAFSLKAVMPPRRLCACHVMNIHIGPFAKTLSAHNAFVPGNQFDPGPPKGSSTRRALLHGLTSSQETYILTLGGWK
jgi:hypothetical protein